MTWLPIEPEDVAKVISFVARADSATSEWNYHDLNQIVAKLQAEGVAGITSILAREPDGVAILADEVGMGKTVQAFGVMTMLWQRKPNAKVLVVVPKSHLIGQWLHEYRFFCDKLIRAASVCQMAREAKTLRELVDLRRNTQEDEPLFVLTRLSIFSNLPKDEASALNKAEQAREFARAQRRSCPDFDFLVFDEAHYLRTKDGGSQRVAAVDAFLGRDRQIMSKPFAEKTLLMTGTPNHSSNEDVKTVLTYFVPAESELLKLKPGGILSRIAIRRLRKLAGKSKYQYRNESECPCAFPQDDPSAEVYFALYQRGLAHLESKDSDGKGKTIHMHEQRRFLYGYLEGFESLLSSQPEPSPDKSDDREFKDYYQAEDTNILQGLATLWGGAVPEHPKYDGSLKQVIPGEDYWTDPHRAIEADKVLIFVRRIPSCHEMVTRVNARYDRLMLGKILRAAGRDASPTAIDALVRYTGTEFRTALDKALPVHLDDMAESQEAEELLENGADKAVPSRVMDYFRTHAKSVEIKDRYTTGSRFRKRFETEKSPFRHFFSTPKSLNSCEVPTEPQTFGDIYLNSIQGDAARMQEWNQFVGWYLKSKSSEAFFERFLRKGILLASPGIVELFAWFLEAGDESGFGGFCHMANERFNGSACQRLTARAIACYQEFVTKFISEKDALEWNQFNAIDPAEFCSGEVGEGARERLIHTFNSPFFPNVLVATSVFQEGVNLHYHCRKMMHYGIAWTPGDNEQRVGRVDRLQGAVERSILAAAPESKDGHLDISYPYLAGTFDEDQLGQFVVRKRSAEDVLDKGEVLRPDKSIDATFAERDWASQLRKPGSSREDSEGPYPWPRP